MERNPLERVVGFVTDHSRITIAVMLVLTLVAGAGATAIQAPPDQELASDSTAQEKLEYIRSNYDTGRSNVTTVGVYLRDTDGNVLSKPALLAALRYERDVANDSAVAGVLTERRGITSVAGVVSARLAGSPAASYERRIDALRTASESRVETAVAETLAPDSELLALLPASYRPGTASAESMRIAVRFRSTGESGSAAGAGPTATSPAVRDAQQVLFDRAATATSDGGTEYFMISGPARGDFSQRAVGDNLELIGPVALVLIVVTLAFAYRDLADLIVGVVGVVLTLVWMFGLIGWLGVPFGSAGIIAPILLIGLSIDYGIHVFMRYREERAATGSDSTAAGPNDIRPSMARGLGGVGVALVLVTVTTAIGFLANLTNSLGSIRQLALATALGVVAALVVFVTIVPALKVELEGLLEWVGFERRKSAIGVGGGRVTRFLTAGVSAARVSAAGVVVVAAVLGAGGAYAWTDLDRQLGTMPEEPADWKQELPDPIGVEEYPLLDHFNYVQDNFRAAGADYSPAQIVVEGTVSDPATLERVETATADVADTDVAYERADGSVPVRTPLTVMEGAATRSETFAEVYGAADTDGDGIPDRNLERVYDALFSVAPGQAASVIERSEGGYRSLRVVVPMRQAADERDVASAMRTAANAIEGEGNAVSATATGDDVVLDVQGTELTRNMLTTLLVSLVAILGLLAIVYRIAEGRASLGVVTVVPVALVVAWVLAGMWLLSVPLTLFTALMISLAIGLGVDYSIHVSERFAQEFEGSTGLYEAMETAVVGTGGALMGSTATTVGAFATLSLSTFPALRQMGLMVGLALVLSFVASVFVLPSVLVLWARVVDGVPASGDRPETTATASQD
jgi:predicted RND superfamily exporter protein